MRIENSDRFENALQTVTAGNQLRVGIGTLGEKTVHAVLKNYFEPYADSQERQIGGFTADIVGENGVMEIQTANFQSLRKKLAAFLEVCAVTVVYPIYQSKRIFTVNPQTGEKTGGRKSPKKGTPYDVFSELYKIKSLLKHENFRLCLVLLDAEEIRISGYEHGGRKNRKGYSLYDRIPVRLLEEIHIRSFDDWRYFYPETLCAEAFTSADYAKAAKIHISAAQTALNILTEVNAVTRIGKKGRYFLYKI